MNCIKVYEDTIEMAKDCQEMTRPRFITNGWKLKSVQVERRRCDDFIGEEHTPIYREFLVYVVVYEQP